MEFLYKTWWTTEILQACYKEVLCGLFCIDSFNFGIYIFISWHRGGVGGVVWVTTHSLELLYLDLISNLVLL